ncbi:MAG TPA: tetratricopeptide repeat protein [Stellaceae bacterium]|nr:tetratricopeptide repeat protein [Stellaceae bacterium]
MAKNERPPPRIPNPMPARPASAIAAKFERALALHRQGNLAQAEWLYRQVIDREPGHVDALHLLGVIAYQRGRFDDAARLIGRALALKPDFVQALFHRGTTLMALRRPEEALASFDKALALKPDFPEALCQRGHALMALQRLDAALLSFERALAIRPDFAEALNGRGNALLEAKRPDDALASFDRALENDPNYVAALNNRGNALLELRRLDDAVASWDRAVALRPDYFQALTNRGNALAEWRRVDEALASYARALEIKPDDADAHWHESLCHLLAGDFSRGWEKYEWRWRRQSLPVPPRDFTQKLWLGAQDLAGKTLLLHAEQGFGDTIQFCRYATLAAERGARVVLEVQGALKALMSGLDGVERVVARGETLPPFDLHCPLMSLPLAFKTTLTTVPARVPYLKPAPHLVEKWRQRLGEHRAPRIGLVWFGSSGHQNDRNRSIALSRLAPFLDNGATLVSLQNSLRDEDRQGFDSHKIHHFGSELRDFADTAALTSLIDSVISVDTAVAHLAGALGKRIFILLPFIASDWRWLTDRDDSPWYPTARVYRQSAIDDWESVLERVARELPR